MTIDWWGIGLQALNVLILIWLLSRVLWRPIAQAIEQRRAATQGTLEAANTAQAEAEARLATLTQAHAGIAAKRSKIISEANARAETLANDVLAKARQQVEELISNAHDTATRESDHARQQNTKHAISLAVDIAGKLLAPLNGPAVHAEFCERLRQKIITLSDAERSTLAKASTALSVVTPALLSATQQGVLRDLLCRDLLCRNLLRRAPLSNVTLSQDRLTQDSQAKNLSPTESGELPHLSFEIEPALLAGVELRSAHFALDNSWQSDLAVLMKAFDDMPSPTPSSARLTPSTLDRQGAQHVS